MRDTARTYSRDNALPPPTPEAEVQRILSEQSVELDWWEEEPKFADAAEVAQAIKTGQLIQVPDIGVGYKIEVKGVPPERRCLTSATSALLQEVSRRWISGVRHAQLDAAQFLVVTSLTRPTDYQHELQQAGVYPAAEDSSHERGLAFDMAVKWFRSNSPRAAEILQRVLDDLKHEELINWIDETTVGCFHICPSPKYIEQYETSAVPGISDKAAE